jgi:putative membrane protein
MSRAQWMRVAVLLVTLAGLGITVALLMSVGIGDVLAVVRRIGVIGFLLYAGLTFVLLGVMGVAWWLVAPGAVPGRLPAFIWARTTREAASDVLPFSQVGGIVVGARSLVATGVPQPLVYASIVADQTTELAAQLVYTLYGVAALALLLSSSPSSNDLLAMTGIGAVASIAIMIAFTVLQRPLLMFAGRIGGAVLPGSAAAMGSVRAALDAVYRHRGRVVAGFVLHIFAWVGSGAGAWVALTLIGVDISVEKVIIIESLIFTLRTAAFIVPGAIGLQEGAYVLLAPLFGLPVEAALALSLLKRARDLAIGVPVMLAFAAGEGRGLAGETG